MEQLVQEIMQCMQENLSVEQQELLRNTLYIKMHSYDISEKSTDIIVYDDSGMRLLKLFLSTKKVEGCSEKTIKYYYQIVSMLLQDLGKCVEEISTNDLRYYLAKYKQDRQVSNITLDNMRRIFSTFFGWLSDEDHISKNPARRLHMIKTDKIIKKPFNHEEREKIRLECTRQRDLALVEFLYSTGVRVSELVGLDKEDIDFGDKEVIVFGKGAKEREVYINAQSCLHLKNYLASREDSNPALFVGVKAPYNRLTIAGVEDILKRIGRRAGVDNVHPHRYRRTMATNALERGMPLQEVSQLLGHSKIETTMIYCSVNQESVKFSHKKYLSA